MTQQTDFRSRARDARKRWGGGFHALAGVIVLVGLVGGVGWWSVATTIEGAVIASAHTRVESQAKPVKHREGGVVGEVLVREGDSVTAGQTLIRLDTTTSAANLAIVVAEISELTAQRARLEAERSGRLDVDYPDDLRTEAARDPALAKILRDQRQLFDDRQITMRQQQGQLTERIGQLEKQILGAESRTTATRNQLASLEEELQNNRYLLRQGIVTRSRVQQFERQVEQTRGELGVLEQNIQAYRGQIEETRFRMVQLTSERREEAVRELRQAQARLAELREQKIVAEDALRKAEILAPQTGVIQSLSVFARGAVLGPGETAMMVVPVGDRLVLQANVPPQDVDELFVGQSAYARFSSFNQRLTPEIEASVSKISADRFVDESTGAPFYRVELTTTDSELEKLGEVRLMPGLPAEVFIRTGERSPLNYLMKPVSDNLERAWR